MTAAEDWPLDKGYNRLCRNCMDEGSIKFYEALDYEKANNTHDLEGEVTTLFKDLSNN